MAGGAGVRRPSLRVLVAGSAVAGVLLGAGAFALDPLPVRAALGAHAPTPPTEVPTTSTATTATPTTAPPTTDPLRETPTPTPRQTSPTVSSPSSVSTGLRTPSGPPTPAGPPFTRLALLQTDELLAHGWGEATELSLQEGVVEPSLLRCVRPDRLAQQHLAAYAATYESRRTRATEQVVRFASPADAGAALGRLVDQVGACGDAGELRATVGSRHRPDLEGVSDAVWWDVRGASTDDPMRGVVALVRVDDRLVVLYLHSTVTDPAETTDVAPLMRQAGLRLV